MAASSPSAAAAADGGGSEERRALIEAGRNSNTPPSGSRAPSIVMAQSYGSIVSGGGSNVAAHSASRGKSPVDVNQGRCASPASGGSGANTPHYPSSARARATRNHSSAAAAAAAGAKRTSSSNRIKRSYWTYYVPILSWLPKYSWRNFAGDTAAALTLACLLVPQSMSYASGLAHLDPVNGLFGVILPAALYALLGTCGQLSMGPEAALSLLIGQTGDRLVDVHKHWSPEKQADVRAGIASAVVFEVGLITFLLGILRLGFLDAVLSRALLRGFITAVGCVIFIEQLSPLLGLSALARAHGMSSATPIEKLFFAIDHVRSTHRLTALISVSCLIVLIGAKVIKPKLAKRLPAVTYIPEILIVVVIVTALSSSLHWSEHGVDVLGKVSAGVVHVHFPVHSRKMIKYAFSSDVLSSAVTIAIMGYVDSIVAAKQNASRYNYAISPNRELTALGIANLGASLVSGTIPGYGSITRSRLAANAGARTPMTSFLVASIVLFSTFFLLQYLFFLPKAVLGCVISLVIYSILAECPEDVRFFWRLRAWTDFALMALTFILTLFVSVQTGIIVSVIISLLLVVRQSSKSMGIQIMGRVRHSDEWIPIGENPDEDDDDDDDSEVYEDSEGNYVHGRTEEVPGILIVRLRETLHFANAGALKERLRRLELYGDERHHPSDSPSRSEAQVIVLHMKDLLRVDASALQILYETCENYVQRGVQVYLVHVNGDLRRSLERAHILGLIGRDHVQSSVKSCLDALKDTAVSSLPYEAV